MARSSTLLAGLLIMTACGNDPIDESTSTTNQITGAGSSSTTFDAPPMTSTFGSSSSSSSGDATTGGSTTGQSSTTTDDPFTTGVVPDFGDAPGCDGKIDLLFVLDRADTMVDEYPTLMASLPLFFETIQDEWDDFDVHIMNAPVHGKVWGMWECEAQCAENNGAGCEPLGPADYPCWAYEEQNLNACDQTFGAGVTFPAAFFASNKRCELHGGNRYIVGDDPNLEESFECITNVGVSTINGSAPAQAMYTALSPELLAPDACNEGFLRDDAMLVIVIVTDTYETISQGEPEDWAATILELKGGDQDAIAVVLLNPDGFDVDNPVCDGPGDIDAFETPLVDFLELFDNGIRGSICEPSFAPFFDEAAQLVVETCKIYTPQ